MPLALTKVLYNICGTVQHCATTCVTYIAIRNRRGVPLCLINGRNDLCQLRYNQLTHPGTHNSGSGFSGDLRLRDGSSAPVCFYRNQGLDYTAQLEFGIRWFDIDLCWVTEQEVTAAVPAGLWTCHSNGYAGFVDEVLRQVDEWLDDNIYNDVVSLHFNGDYDRSRSAPIAAALNDLLVSYWWGDPSPQTKKSLSKLSMNSDFNLTGEWPRMSRAVGRNERIFVFLHESLQLGDQPWAHDTIPSRSPSEVIKDSCDSLIEFTRGACDVCTDLFGVDAIGSRGNCIFQLAEICNRVTLNVSRACFDLRMQYGKTLNVIEVDYPERSPEDLSVVEVANMLNDLNLNYFTSAPVDVPNATDCNPGFIPTPSPSPLPRPTTYCEALMQISETPLRFFQCETNDVCDRLVCPIDLLATGALFRIEIAVTAGDCDEPAVFHMSIFSPLGGDPLGTISATETGIFTLATTPLLITVDQMESAIGVEVIYTCICPGAWC